jgi:hypothetical protein
LNRRITPDSVKPEVAMKGGENEGRVFETFHLISNQRPPD